MNQPQRARLLAHRLRVWRDGVLRPLRARTACERQRAVCPLVLHTVHLQGALQIGLNLFKRLSVHIHAHGVAVLAQRA